MSLPRRVLASAAALLAVPLLAAVPAQATSRAGSLRVLAGGAPETSLFPSDTFTVADPAQLTGRRVNLPVPTCTEANRSVCDGLLLLNQLDGFDLQPRVSIPFSGPVQVDSVNDRTVYVDGPDGHLGLQQVVYDPDTHVLTGNPATLLREDTVYTVTVTGGVLDDSGHPIAAPAGTTFTTMTASTELDRLRRALDDGSAYSHAGIAASDRVASFAQGGTSTVFPGPAVVKEGISRSDQVAADQSKPKATATVPDLVDPGSIGDYVFGSFLSPQFVNGTAVIPPVPSSATPPAQSAARLGFAMILPAGTPPAGGWPVAVYGPGFTRSYFDLFVTSDHNATAGIATVAIDPLGHGFGPASTITVKAAPTGAGQSAQTTFLSYGRGHDLDGDGAITNDEGVMPTDHKTFSGAKLVDDAPPSDLAVGLRDGLVQSTSDNMALVRLLERGVTVPTPTGSVPLSTKNVMYYGLSFGGIYGTMLMGTDPDVKVGYLDVPGGPIIDIARLSGFRPLIQQQLGVARPNLLNGGPGLDGFTESLPLPDDPRETHPAPGSATIRQFLSFANWLERPGSPETFAPLIRLRPRYGAKTVLFATAFGDHTVPNFTAGNIYRAGQLFDRLSYYRNDKTPTSGTDPHGFLADPTLAGRSGGELQLTAFLQSDGATLLDPDGPGPVFEVPVANPDNLLCLHYAEPQTGGMAYPPGASGECPQVPAQPTAHPASDTSGSTASGTATGGSGSTGASGSAGSSATTGAGSSATTEASTGSLARTGGAPVVALGGLVLLLAAVTGRRLSRR